MPTGVPGVDPPPPPIDLYHRTSLRRRPPGPKNHWCLAEAGGRFCGSVIMVFVSRWSRLDRGGRCIGVSCMVFFWGGRRIEFCLVYCLYRKDPGWSEVVAVERSFVWCSYRSRIQGGPSFVACILYILGQLSVCYQTCFVGWTQT